MRQAIFRVACVLLVVTGASIVTGELGPTSGLEPDGAPARSEDGPGVPAAIVWPAPRLRRGPFLLESAEQPWSMAFLPGGDILVTGRPGRLRRIHRDVLLPAAVPGVPVVRAHALQGLMDVVLHPNSRRITGFT